MWEGVLSAENPSLISAPAKAWDLPGSRQTLAESTTGAREILANVRAALDLQPPAL